MSRSKVNTSADVDEFRIIPSSKCEFGCNDDGTPKKRLIVFEDDNQAYVRQYTDLGTKNLWSCLNCKKNSKFNNDVFMAPINHTCTPITYQEAIEQQNLIKAKKAPKQSVGGGGNAEENDVEINPTYINSLSKLEILPSNYEFGVDIKNTLNARVFVFEEHDRNFGRQYGKQGDKYFCRGCYYLAARKVYAVFKDENIFCVPPIHLCKPRKYEEVMEEQQKIKEKFDTIANEAAVIASTPSTSSSSQNMPKVLLSIKPAIASISLQTNPITEEELNRLRNSANIFRPSFSSIPSPPINVLPGFRVVDLFEFEYGFNEHGEKLKRILVREPNDRKFLREYYSTETGIWQCLNCSIGTATKIDENFCVPIEHDCEPIPLNLSKERQSTYQVLYKALQTASPYSINNDSLLSRFSFENNIRRSSGNSARVTKRMSTAENAGYSNGMMTNKRARNSFGQPSFLNNSYTSTSSQLLGNISINGSQRYQPSNPTTTVKLYKPSSFTLEKLCQKLGIDYSDNAYQFWLNINIKQISPSSIPDEVFSVTTTINPGFSSISLFLTGSETFASKIKEDLNKYFIVNHKTLGESLGQDLSRLDHPLVSQTLFQESATELHFETIIHLFQCRIGIFCDGKWKRYGNWNETNADIPVFLMEKKNDNYFPILSLKN
uniref:Uncharacterized protein n=1 Tax=Panagrolaimus sp. PS1159 TaxID=55785 RepID=A0AC35F6D8_9BILA